MTILSSQHLKSLLESDDSELDVSPIDLDNQLQPASIDLRMGNKFKSQSPANPNGRVHLSNPELTYAEYDVSNSESFLLEPGEFMLAETKETISVPSRLLGRVTGRSSVGRLGQEVHCTAGLCDPGWSGTVTLELKNKEDFAILIEPGIRVAQICFETLTSEPIESYAEKKDSKYNNQSGPTPSRISEDHDR